MKPPQKTSPSVAGLDSTELTHLAIKAMRSGRDDDALRHLQRAIERDPRSANPHHLRGAILASQGQPKQAIEAMTHALTLDPSMQGPRFQLGLLHFTSGNTVEAQSVWQALDDLDEHHPLRLFKTGMMHLAKDDFENCVALLRQGISLCNVESLNKDMQRVIDKVSAVVLAQSATAQPSAKDNAQHVMLARYGKTPDDPTSDGR